MIHILGVFLIIFVMLSAFIGLGLIILAYFNLAPAPEWMKKYKKRNAKSL
jgi:predicted membrane protein